jgi:hypothetical protein
MRPLLGREPALYLTGALAILQLIAIMLHLTGDQQNALSVIATAVYTVLLAVFTRPMDTAAITGGIATVLTAIGVFGIHLAPNLTSALNATVAAVLALILRVHVTPAPALTARP